MIVAITGGTGFIGKQLVKKHLNLGDEVRLLTRAKVTLEHGNLKMFECDLVSCSSGELEAFLKGADVFYHCAGEIKNKSQMHLLHVLGTEKLIEAARGEVKRWVQLSSTGVYGSVEKGVVNEDSMVCPVGEYEETKAKSDLLVSNAGEKGYFDYVIVRPSVVVGKEMPNQSVFQLIRAIIKHRFFFIGNQATVLNYIHVNNVVYFLYLCGVHKEAFKTSYIISDKIYLTDFVEIVCKEMGYSKKKMFYIPKGIAYLIVSLAGWMRPFPLTYNRIKALTSEVVYASEKAKKELGHIPVITIEETVRELVCHCIKGDCK